MGSLTENETYRCRHCRKPYIGAAGLKATMCSDCRETGHEVGFSCWSCQMEAEVKRKIAAGEIVVLRIKEPDLPPAA